MEHGSPTTVPGKRRRVLYVFNASWFFLSHRVPFALAALRAGYEVHVAAAPLPGDAEKIEAMGMTFHPLPFARRGMNPLHELKTVCSLFRLFAALKPDLVEQATIKPVLYGNLVAKCFRSLKTVNWMTGLGYVFISDTLRGALLRKAVVLLYRFSLKSRRAKVIFENPDDQGHFTAQRIVVAGQSVVIRGAGVDTALFAPTPEPASRPTVVLPARLLWDKGVGEFVEAAGILKAQGAPQARFVLVGDGDDGNPASVPGDRLRHWEEEGVVEWWGRRNDMSAVFAQSHIVCLPSYREGLPKVLLEAAASGRPIVTTDVPGCREVVRDQINGLLVPVRDSRSLARALGRLLEDGTLRGRMGAAGRAIAVQEFTEDLVVAQTLALYRELLGPHP